jgi:hypothetical protein
MILSLNSGSFKDMNPGKRSVTLLCLMLSLYGRSQLNPGNSQFATPAPNPQTFANTIDAAVGYNAWALANNENSFKRIGGYKVKGTPYLFGGAYKGDVYAKNQVGKQVTVGYDTYQQQLEVYMGSKDPIVKGFTEIDSFVLRADSNTYFKEDMFFLNAGLFDSTKNFFIMKIYEGKRFSLYKAYHSVLGVVSENYVQSELRQFDLNVDFYYFDNAKKGLTRLKLSPKFLKSEFKEFINVGATLDLEILNRNPQFELLKIFIQLNN